MRKKLSGDLNATGAQKLESDVNSMEANTEKDQESILSEDRISNPQSNENPEDDFDDDVNSMTSENSAPASRK